MSELYRIIVHWTAGAHKACATDIQAYHFIIESDGRVLSGKFKPEDNKICVRGKYAKHTGGGNTGSIGISLCGMCGYKSRNNVGNYPLTKVQCEKAFDLLAQKAVLPPFIAAVFPIVLFIISIFIIKKVKDL